MGAMPRAAPPPGVDRQRQVETARGWVAELSAGRGRAALIEGEPGIGKSTLARALAAEARRAGSLVLWASCDELSQAFPLLPLLDALSVRAPATGCDPARIVELLRADVTRGNGGEVVPAAVERLLTLVDELSAAAPVLLVVDDLQWADAATVMALGRLARSVRQLPMLVVGTSRPVPRREDLLALRRMVEPAALLRLHSLTDAEAAQLVGRAVGGVPGPRLLRLARGAAGNPLYLTELVDALIRSGALVAHDGMVEATGGRPPDSLPAAIADRLEFLSAPVHDVLRTAALLGVDFSVSELAVLSGQRVGDLLSVLDEAILAGVLLENGVELAFRHPLIRRALYDGIPAAVRAAWHRDAARALAADGAPVARVARQLLPAVDADDITGAVDEWVTRWLGDAGHQLVGQAPKVAIPLLRCAIGGVPAGVAPHDLLACRLADALYRVGDPAGAAQVATAALAYVTRPDVLVDLQSTLTLCRIGQGRSEEALADLVRTLDRPDLEPGDRARLQVLVARIHRSLGRVDIAGEVANVALAQATAAEVRQLADDTGNAIRLAQAHGVLGELLYEVGRWDDALAEFELGSGLTNPSVECSAHGMAATIQFHRGAADAPRHLRDAERSATMLGDRVLGPLLLARSLEREHADQPAQALAVLMAGIPDPAMLSKAADEYAAAGRPLPRAQALEAAAMALADAGDVTGARAHFTDAFAVYTDLGAQWDLARTQATFRSYGIRR